MVLIQPDFLFLLEPAGEEKRPISELELASRLSYFLWSTMPDDRLMELADAGQLRAESGCRSRPDACRPSFAAVCQNSSLISG